MKSNQNPAKKTLVTPKLDGGSKIALIYNPHAGAKRRMFPSKVPPVSLEEVKQLLKQYQIPVDYIPTKYPGHATILAKEAVKKGYTTVLVAGGDGTVGEVANGLIGTDVTLGIVPLGSFMNVAKMLSIPTELEKAINLIKIGRTRKIDAGCITKLEGKKLTPPHFFIESSGIGLEAEIFGYIQELEKGNYGSILHMLKTYFDFFRHKVQIKLNDREVINTRAALVTISNGPYMGAGLPVAPKAKLNDHRLTLSIFKMTRYELLIHFFRLSTGKIKKSRKIQIMQAKKILITTRNKRLVHADGRFFGQTPAEFTIVPNALNVITGFPKAGDSSLVKRTYLDY
jgi:diacylglycerol kinase (ATP)